MLGRGIPENPGLVHSCGQQKQTASRMRLWLRKHILPRIAYRKRHCVPFHDEVCDGYKAVMSGDRNTLFKMKELWGYLGKSFTNPEKYLKKIRKTERLAEYYVIVDALFREQELIVRL